MVPLLFAAVALAPSTALAFDVDLWRPGPSSASPGDALTAPSAWTMGAGQTSIRWANLWVPGTLHSVVVPASCEREAVLAGSVEPGTACARDLASIVGQDGSTTVPEDAYLERPLLGPITTTALVVERGLGPNAAVGMRVRGLWSTSPHSEHGEVADIGPLVDGLGQPRITDGSLWAHWSLPLSERLRMGIAPELRLDSDILVGDLPEIPHIGTVSGTGTGVASAFSVGWQPPVRAGADPLRLTAAVTPGLALAPTGRVPEVAPFSTDAWVSASWAFSSSWTAIGESSLHWFSHATDVPSFVTMTWIQRVGVRWTPHPSWTVLATGAYAGSRSPGAPGPSPGLEVQWRQRRAGAGPAARPAGPGEILIAPVDPGGRGIMLPLPEDVPGARAAEPGPGWIVPFVAGGTLSAGGGDWITRTQPVTVDGPGPWTWRPVLLPREGDATARVTVVDAAGTPISVDTLVLDGVDIGPVAAGSVLELEGVRPGPLDLVATGSLIDGIVVPSIADMDPDRDPLVVALPVGATRVEVDAAEGATLRARSAIEERSVPLDPSGRALFSLEPGRWVLRAEAPGQGAQERTLEVDDGRDTIEIVEFKLKEAAEDGADLVVSVFDADGRPVPDAEVRVGEDAIGRTATGGRLRVEGLDAGVTQLSVAADDFRTQAPARLTLSAEAATEVEVPLSHQAGVVRLEVRSDTGSPLRDVLVRFVGSTLIDPLPLGPDGVLDTVLPAGSWEAVVSAPGFYQQVVDVIVRPERERRLDLEVVLRAPAPEVGRLLIRVEDDRERPVEGALITLGGEVLGRTSTGGRLGVEGLAPGALPLAVVAPLHDPWSGQVEVVTGPEPAPNTVSLRLAPGILQIEAADSAGPLNAWTRVLGPMQTPGFLLGPDGTRRIAVPPGDWEVVLSEPSHGLMVEDVSLSPDSSAVVRWEAGAPEAAAAIRSLERVPLTVSVVDAARGVPIDAQIRMLGPEVLPLLRAAPGEPAVTQVQPGFWEIVASSPEYGIGGTDLSVQRAPPPPVVVPLGEQRAKVTVDAVEISDTIEFALDSAQLAPASTDLLREIARTLQLHPELTRIVIEGHTDDSGDVAHNEILSRARAEAVRAWLVASGVAGSRLETVGFGARSPVTDNDSAAGRARNRRVEFRIVSRREVQPQEP